LALLGVAFYTLLVPLHFTSQLAAQLYRADVGIFADTMCIASADGRSDPTMPASNCPICKGLAAFQMAVGAEAQVALPTMPVGAPASAIVHDDVAGAGAPAPRSRGPPLQA
jgi:hypothetical protein